MLKCEIEFQFKKLLHRLVYLEKKNDYDIYVYFQTVIAFFALICT